MLLCDAAQGVGGKLYILGGGWSQLRTPNTQVPMALAIRLAIPWDMANQPIPVRAQLVTSDGQPVNLGGGPIVAEATVEVGRPAGLERGTPLDAILAVNLGGIALAAGRYVWELRVSNEVRARAPFQVMPGPQ
jgi:hypothetical protein